MKKEVGSDSPSDPKRWVANWRKAEKRLELVRVRELALIKLEDQILALEDALQAALVVSGPSTTSGLVEQQALFSRMRG